MGVSWMQPLIVMVSALGAAGDGTAGGAGRWRDGGAAASAGGVFAGDGFPWAPSTAPLAIAAATNTPIHCLCIKASLVIWSACVQATTGPGGLAAAFGSRALEVGVLTL